MVNMFPNSEPILLRRVAPASTDEWVLVNGRCDHTAVCVWPVIAVQVSYTHEMFEPLVTNRAKVDYRFVYDKQWELLTCTWASPAQQVQDYGALRTLAIAPAHLRLVCLHGPEVYLIFLKRVAEDSVLEGVAEDADFQELLDRSDRAKIEENIPKRASKAKTRKAFLNKLEPLKRKVCVQQKAERDRLACEARARGPTYYQ
jgi:hypothetical protein